MITTILLWFLYACIFAIYGAAGFWLFSGQGKTESDVRPPLSALILFGMLICEGLALWLNFFLPLNGWIFSIMVLGALVLAWLMYKKNTYWRISFAKSWDWQQWLKFALMLAIFLFILINTITIPKNSDSGQYHAQTIHWAETYRIVPGLGNLHDRLAYNSSWLVLQAMFSLAFVGQGSFHLLPGLLFVLVAIELINQWDWKTKTLANLVPLYALCLLLWLIWSQASEISSPGTDLPVILLGGYAILMLLKWFKDPQKQEYAPLLVSGLVFWALTIKLSAAPLLLIPILMVLKQPQIRKDQFRMVILFLLLILPWLIRNLILSGYILYPIPIFDVFHFWWKVPRDIVLDEQIAIRAWARFPRLDAATMMAMPFKQWVKVWFIDFSLNRKLIILLSVGIPMLLMITQTAWKGLRVSLQRYGFNWVVAILSIGWMYWFITAPNIRFGFAYILPLLAIAAAGLAHAISLKLSPQVNLFLYKILPVLAIAFSLLLFLKSINVDTVHRYWLKPADYPLYATEPCPIENGMILCASEYEECWYTPFPCIPKIVDNVFMRGNRYDMGFYTRQP